MTRDRFTTKLIGVLADVHANLPATRAALGLLDDCDEIIFLGDAVGIGPQPRETLELLLDRGVTAIRGNHDEYLDFLPVRPEAELQHELWVRAQVPDEMKAPTFDWPYGLSRRLGQQTATFLRYPLRDDAGPEDKNRFVRFTDPTPANLEEIFAAIPGDLVVFGHHHTACDLTVGQRRYLNPGSVGCSERPLARVAVLSAPDGRIRVEQRSASYDLAELLPEYERRHVPGREVFMASYVPKAGTPSEAP